MRPQGSNPRQRQSLTTTSEKPTRNRKPGPDDRAHQIPPIHAAVQRSPQSAAAEWVWITPTPPKLERPRRTDRVYWKQNESYNQGKVRAFDT